MWRGSRAKSTARVAAVVFALARTSSHPGAAGYQSAYRVSRQISDQSAPGAERDASSCSSQASLTARAPSGSATVRRGRRAMRKERRKGGKAQRRPGGKEAKTLLCLQGTPQLRVHPAGSAGRGIQGGVNAPAPGQQPVIVDPADLDEALPGGPGGLAHPGAGYQPLPDECRGFVVDLVPGHHPVDSGLELGRCLRVPVRLGGLLHPAEVDHVVHVALAVDVGGRDEDGQPEDVHSEARWQGGKVAKRHCLLASLPPTAWSIAAPRSSTPSPVVALVSSSSSAAMPSSRARASRASRCAVLDSLSALVSTVSTGRPVSASSFCMAASSTE